MEPYSEGQKRERFDGKFILPDPIPMTYRPISPSRYLIVMNALTLSSGLTWLSTALYAANFFDCSMASIGLGRTEGLASENNKSYNRTITYFD